MTARHSWSAAALAASLCIAAAAAAASPICDTVASTWRHRQLRCLLPTEMPAGPMRFVARFDGGHDDTEVSLALTLDGRPLACGPGSRTELVGGDGEVVLECRFDLACAAGASPRELGAMVRFHHADFAATLLEAR